MKNSDSVMEFLAGIPMLQRLPISTLKRIAEVADVAKFGAGEYVIRKGEGADGLYFIKEGEVVVSGQSDAEKGLERHLKANDCFGSCALLSNQRVDVLALSELTCLVLPREHCKLLQSKSIWTFDERYEVNLFLGSTLPGAPRGRQIFGGQLIGQIYGCCSLFDSYSQTG